MASIDKYLNAARKDDSSKAVISCREYSDGYLFSRIDMDGTLRIGEIGVFITNDWQTRYPSPQFFVNNGPGKVVSIDHLMTSKERRALSLAKTKH